MTDQGPDYPNVQSGSNNLGKNLVARKMTAIMSAWRLGRTCEVPCDPGSDN